MHVFAHEQLPRHDLACRDVTHAFHPYSVCSIHLCTDRHCMAFTPAFHLTSVVMSPPCSTHLCCHLTAAACSCAFLRGGVDSRHGESHV